MSLIRNYTLSTDDLEIIGYLRGAANRLVIAAHLSLLRNPGFGLQTNEELPIALLKFIATQLFTSPDAFSGYGEHQQTRADHATLVATYLGLRPFAREDIPFAIGLAARAAARSDRGETIASILMDDLKAERFILPAPDTIERAGPAGRARARKRAAAELVAKMETAPWSGSTFS